jgi:hypothetical protein
MKRTELLKHLREHGCVFIREGGSHFLVAEFRESIWWLLGGFVFPIVSFVFLCVHFNEAWPSAKICLIGFLVMLVGVLLPELQSMNL